ncbi:hypothetical protein HGA88_06085 [Candidatus Roizmanbacteria bacterium]|nr:hypothetical protein [Candidatus Roizmanbacteria bacterium]
MKKIVRTITSSFNSFTLSGVVLAQTIQVQPGAGANALGFNVPNFSMVLTFFIRAFFIVVGLAALLYLLLGALSWVTSGGSKENVEKAREKISAAVIGVILVVVALAIIVTLEQVVFKNQICFGISCPITVPNLL